MRALGLSLLAVSLVVVAAYVALVIHADRRFDGALREASCVRVRDARVGEPIDGVAEVWLWGEGGEEAVGLLLAPPRGDSVRVRILLLGGIGTGKNAARLVDPIPGAEVLALDYPLSGRLPRGNALARAAALPSMVDGVAESLVSFALAKRYLERGGTRTVLVGVSLGVPFAAALASAGEKPGAVALLYGGADVGAVIAQALPGGPAPLRTAAGRILGRIVARLDPARTAGGIAPAPLLLVNAAEDPRIPGACVRALREAAREPKKVVVLEGGHVLPEKADLLRALIAEVLVWLREVTILQGDGGEGDPAVG